MPDFALLQTDVNLCSIQKSGDADFHTHFAVDDVLNLANWECAPGAAMARSRFI
jgi:hypothetical protein